MVSVSSDKDMGHITEVRKVKVLDSEVLVLITSTNEEQPYNSFEDAAEINITDIKYLEEAKNENL